MTIIFNEQQKTPKELLVDFLQRVWPSVYRLTNGIAETILTNIRRFLQSVVNQLAGPRR